MHVYMCTFSVCFCPNQTLLQQQSSHRRVTLIMVWSSALLRNTETQMEIFVRSCAHMVPDVCPGVIWSLPGEVLLEASRCQILSVFITSDSPLFTLLAVWAWNEAELCSGKLQWSLQFSGSWQTFTNWIILLTFITYRLPSRAATNDYFDSRLFD